MDKIIDWISTMLVVFTFVWIIVFIYSIPLYFMWNWLVPDIFNLPTITFLQAIGLNILFNILFRPTSIPSSNKEK